MANNRMALVCVKCNEGMAIAKYYPSTGWYPIEQGDMVVEQWMETHRQKCGVESLGDGKDAYRLAYESDGMKDWHYVGDVENKWRGLVSDRNRVIEELEKL